MRSLFIHSACNNRIGFHECIFLRADQRLYVAGKQRVRLIEVGVGAGRVKGTRECH